jgi:hypothetical protein
MEATPTMNDRYDDTLDREQAVLVVASFEQCGRAAPFGIDYAYSGDEIETAFQALQAQGLVDHPATPEGPALGWVLTERGEAEGRRLAALWVATNRGAGPPGGQDRP